VVVSFPTNTGSPLIYGGFGLQFGDVVFHSRGERGRDDLIRCMSIMSRGQTPGSIIDFWRFAAEGVTLSLRTYRDVEVSGTLMAGASGDDVIHWYRQDVGTNTFAVPWRWELAR
jgi:hypothetical protein